MIKVENIVKSYGKKENKQTILKNISLEIKDGDLVVILGASGSGKSTLLNVLSGLERPDSGKISYEQREITSLSDNELTEFRKSNTGFIFQQYYLLPNMTAEKKSGGSGGKKAQVSIRAQRRRTAKGVHSTSTGKKTECAFYGRTHRSA